MMQQATYKGWVFEDIWFIKENESYPIFKCFSLKKIDTPDKLKDFIECKGEFFTEDEDRSGGYRICNDIDMIDVTIDKLAEKPFKGQLYGYKKTIKNLTINFGDQENVGFLRKQREQPSRT